MFAWCTYLCWTLSSPQLSDPGRVRPRNEDYLGHVVPRSPAEARSHGWLFALADGVGGQRQGEVASRAAIEEVIGGFRRAAAMASHRELVMNLVQSANARVWETGLFPEPWDRVWHPPSLFVLCV